MNRDSSKHRKEPKREQMNKSTQGSLASVGLLLINSACTTSAPIPEEAREDPGAKAVMAAIEQGANLSRDPRTQVVTNSRAKLQWEDNAQEPVKKTWKDANQHSDDLDFSGYTD